MRSIVITSEKNEDLQLLNKMARRMNLEVKILSEQETENLFLVTEMEKVDKSKTVPLKDVYKILES